MSSLTPVVVVTGAASGLGAALARRYARETPRVALLDRDEVNLAAVAAELGELGASPMTAVCDITSASECAAAVERVLRRWGGIDILVNNAGITHLGRFRDTDLEVLRKVVDVNFFGAVHMTKAALTSLLERSGRIVVVSSVAGIAPLALRTGYAASKHALHGFFESLRAEHAADGLAITMVCPSFIDTAIGDHALGPDGRTATAGSRTGVRDPVPPEAVADAIVDAVRRERTLLLYPRDARLSYWLARLAPSVFERLMIRRTLRS